MGHKKQSVSEQGKLGAVYEKVGLERRLRVEGTWEAVCEFGGWRIVS